MGKDLTKTRLQSLSRLHFTADLHRRSNKPEPIYIQADGKGLWPMTEEGRFNDTVMQCQSTYLQHIYDTLLNKQIFCKIIQLQHNCYIIETILNIF